jgi:hypothetical protein
VDPEERRFEERRLTRQTWQIIAAFLGPTVAVVVVVVAIRGDLQAQTRAEQARLIAEEGIPACDLVADYFASFFPTEYTSEFDPDEDRLAECRDRLVDRPPSVTVQRELVAQLAAYPAEREGILALSRKVYEDAADDWINEIATALESAEREPA